MELRFLRDRDAREVDVVVLSDRKPLFAAEERTPIPRWYQVRFDGVRILPFPALCSELAIP